ncbi:MAG: RNA 2',3'-cyclic phosphodiesterase [bacterium]|nr:RNA 2',3'-cyclic phosphodiesterase [bacterium]
MIKRIFVSIDLPREVREYFIRIQNPGIYWIKWMKSGNLHITLNFLGDLNSPQIENAKQVLLDVANLHSAFELTLDTVKQERDMLWIMPSRSSSVDDIAETLKERLKHARLGKRERRSFNPHVLLGRSKTGRYMKWKPENFKPVTFTVDKINLYESELTPGAATHRLIESFDLGDNLSLFPSPHEGRAGEGS